MNWNLPRRNAKRSSRGLIDGCIPRCAHQQVEPLLADAQIVVDQDLHGDGKRQDDNQRQLLDHQFDQLDRHIRETCEPQEVIRKQEGEDRQKTRQQARGKEVPSTRQK
jgi:hypothetical protein